MSTINTPINMIKVKICGMFEIKNIQEIAILQPDFMGFIFYPKSKRFVGEHLSFEVLKLLPKNIQKTAVIVNESFEKIIKIVIKYSFDYVQLHGNESPSLCKKLKDINIKIIKAFAVDESFDFNILKDYEDSCEYFLFDTKTPDFGGSGKVFNWQLVEKYQLKIPFFLSGGIGIENIDEALQLKHSSFIGIDCNSALENEDYRKNYEKVAQIIKKTRL